ncbi:unnamed protein product [Rotaria magnacalcarata]|uniref:Uncharacterized protein n=2 Tax=Rotaria magnacalcarata TaxID=392030 RepID=A0A816U5L8_9BILA|nr:unnamed protein product [Rotaria magnacalcarata]CAF1398791.1 unnamed protein product [Rotaria magnacalcarata]CAF2104487.1 unnamed protein product [Rotaria magnacalcarata]CAF2108378.1 unnamed protein product [Rotaria magnacalcarata]
MLTLWQSFLIWIVFLFLMQSTDGLRCYSCSNCNDPFNSNGVQITEGSNDMYCMKTKLLSVVTRSLQPSCISLNDKDDGIWCCEKDLCNSAMKTKTMNSFFSSMIIISVMKFY